MDKVIKNRYEIIKRIGTGGMAEVHLAFDTVLKREVAIKILRHDLSNDPIALLRFKREANSGSGLNHPNIVEIYDVGDEDGMQYIVMEYINGTTAKELIQRRGALEINEAIDFMKQLSYGVAKAHAQGIIHRDIKPQNILVKADGSLKVTDFGIATAGDALQLTKTDSVMGSIHYLAPESVRGEPATFQSDIYAMGIIFYEILSGKLPFEGDKPVEVAMKQLRDPIPSIKSINPNIPNSIVNIISKATSKNPKSRYKNVDEMLRDLSTCMNEDRVNELLWVAEFDTDDNTKLIESLQGLDPSTPKVGPNKKKQRTMIIAAVSVAILALIGIIIATQNRVKPYILIDLVGMTYDEAEAILLEENIYISKSITYDFSDEVEKDLIMATSPEKDSEIERGSQIKVVISQGPLFEIEDYTDQLIDDVKALLEANTKIIVKVVREPKKDVKPGTILKQEMIKPGEKINPNQRLEILFTIASEVEILIPNLIGIPIDSAVSELEKTGVKVRKESIPMDLMPQHEIESLTFNVVIRSNPMQGSTYIQHEDNEIVLYFYDISEKPLFENPGDNDE